MQVYIDLKLIFLYQFTHAELSVNFSCSAGVARLVAGIFDVKHFLNWHVSCFWFYVL
jgi:hypothetical protein